MLIEYTPQVISTVNISIHQNRAYRLQNYPHSWFSFSLESIRRKRHYISNIISMIQLIDKNEIKTCKFVRCSPSAKINRNKRVIALMLASLSSISFEALLMEITLKNKDYILAVMRNRALIWPLSFTALIT